MWFNESFKRWQLTFYPTYFPYPPSKFSGFSWQTYSQVPTQVSGTGRRSTEWGSFESHAPAGHSPLKNRNPAEENLYLCMSKYFLSRCLSLCKRKWSFLQCSQSPLDRRSEPHCPGWSCGSPPGPRAAPPEGGHSWSLQREATQQSARPWVLPL